jgi:hypothetical protein
LGSNVKVAPALLALVTLASSHAVAETVRAKVAVGRVQELTKTRRTEDVDTGGSVSLSCGTFGATFSITQAVSGPLPRRVGIPGTLGEFCHDPFDLSACYLLVSETDVSWSAARIFRRVGDGLGALSPPDAHRLGIDDLIGEIDFQPWDSPPYGSTDGWPSERIQEAIEELELRHEGGVLWYTRGVALEAYVTRLGAPRPSKIECGH